MFPLSSFCHCDFEICKILFDNPGTGSFTVNPPKFRFSVKSNGASVFKVMFKYVKSVTVSVLISISLLFA